MKKIEFDIKNLEKLNQGANWHRGVSLAVLVSLIIYLAGCAYLLVSGVPAETKALIDNEISSIDVRFSESALENVKSRQNPSDDEITSSGKNPFTPF